MKHDIVITNEKLITYARHQKASANPIPFIFHLLWSCIACRGSLLSFKVRGKSEHVLASESKPLPQTASFNRPPRVTYLSCTLDDLFLLGSSHLTKLLCYRLGIGHTCYVLGITVSRRKNFTSSCLYNKGRLEGLYLNNHGLFDCLTSCFKPW